MDSVSTSQIQKAVGALMAYVSGETKPVGEKQNKKLDLFEKDEDFMVVLNLRKVPETDTLKPIPISIPNSIYGRDGVNICLFTKDTQTQFDEYLELNPVKNIKKIVALKTLRTDYKAFQHRRELLSNFDFFLCDSRIAPMLPPLLGSKFYDTKKFPSSVDITKGWKKNLTKARDSTYMTIPKGAIINVKVGTSEFTKDELVENIAAAIPAMVEKIPRKWKNIQSIFIKTTSSAALPIYNSLPEVKDYVKDVEELEAAQEKVARSERATILKKAQKLGLTVKQYNIAVEASEKLNMPLSKYLGIQKSRSLQKTLEEKGGLITGSELTDLKKNKSEDLQKEKAELASAIEAGDVDDVEEEEPKKKKVKRNTKDANTIVSLGKPKATKKVSKK